MRYLILKRLDPHIRLLHKNLKLLTHQLLLVALLSNYFVDSALLLPPPLIFSCDSVDSRLDPLPNFGHRGSRSLYGVATTIYGRDLRGQVLELAAEAPKVLMKLSGRVGCKLVVVLLF